MDTQDERRVTRMLAVYISGQICTTTSSDLLGIATRAQDLNPPDRSSKDSYARYLFPSAVGVMFL